jgi:hypothetical protein
MVTLTYTFGRLTTTFFSLTFRRALDEHGRWHAPCLPWQLLLLRHMVAVVLHLSHPVLHCCCSSPLRHAARRPHAESSLPARIRRGACPGRHRRAGRCGRAGARAGELHPQPLPPRARARARGSSAIGHRCRRREHGLRGAPPLAPPPPRLRARGSSAPGHCCHE